MRIIPCGVGSFRRSNMVFILRPAGGVMLDVAPVVEKVVLIPDDVVVIGCLPERTAAHRCV